MAEWQVTPEPAPSEAHLRAWEVFHEAARRIWRNADFALDHTRLSSLPPPSDSKVLAAVGHTGPQKAIGDSIYRRSSHYTLYLSPRLFSMSDEDIRKVMTHEAIHLGISGHPADFREMARKHGATITEEGLEDPGIHLEVKQGARYKRVATFTSEAQARAAGLQHLRDNPGSRVRLAIG